MTKTNVAVKDAPSKDQLPAYLQGKEYKNQDNFDSNDVVIPRIKLLQGLSQEVADFDEAKTGEFWHTGLDISLGSSFDFVVADRRKKYLLVAPIEDSQGLLARADDFMTWDRTGKWSVKMKGVKQPVTWEIADRNVKNSGLANWGTSNPDDEDSPPAATQFYDYLVFLPDRLDLGPAIISLARSQIRKAKKGLNDKIKLHETNGRPMQALVFNAGSTDDSADGQSFKNWIFKQAGFVQDGSLFKMVLEHRGSLANIKVDQETSDDSTKQPEDDGKGNF